MTDNNNNNVKKQDQYTPTRFVKRDISNPLLNVEVDKFGPPEILHDEIHLETKIGEGAFGEVWRGTCRSKPVAVKIPILQSFTDEEIATVQQEIDTMRRLFHPNIVMLLGGCMRPNFRKGEQIKIVMELCETNVEKLLERDKKSKLKDLTMKKRLSLAKDAALGMDWLHGINKIIHKDLKTANLLIDSTGRVKVSDFGFSVIKPKNSVVHDDQPIGTPLYMAPEVLEGKPHDGLKADIYAFGIILWELITSEKPFQNFKQWNPFKKAVVEEKHRPPIPSHAPTCVAWLLERCWHHDPKERPSFSEIVYRLDECLVDVSITDPKGRKFWKDNFLIDRPSLEDKISWEEFSEVLEDETACDRKLIASIEGILTVQEQVFGVLQKVVTMEHFNKMLHIFGHFFLQAKETSDILKEMSEYLKNPGYFLEIDREAALAKLATSEPGTYLVRMRDPLDPKFPGKPFTISFVKNTNAQHQIEHKLIHHDPVNGITSYGLSGNYHKSLSELIKSDADLKKAYVQLFIPPVYSEQ